MSNSERKKQAKDVENQSSKGFVLGALIGGVIGAGVALFLAPKAGKELRRTVSSEVSSLKEKTGQLRETAVTRGTELVETAKKKSQSISETVSKQSTDFINKIKRNEVVEDNLEEQADMAKNQQNDQIQQMLDETKKAFDETERQLNH